MRLRSFTVIDRVMYLRGIGEEEQAAMQQSFPHLHVVTARCLALFLRPPEQERLLREALALAREHNRPMDEAGCLFSLSAIVPDARERAELYRQATELLEQMEATGWLAGKSPADPPLLPMTI